MTSDPRFNHRMRNLRSRIRNKEFVEVNSLHQALDTGPNCVVICQDLMSKVLPDFLMSLNQSTRRIALVGEPVYEGGIGFRIRPIWNRGARGWLIKGGSVTVIDSDRIVQIVDPVGFTVSSCGVEKFASIVGDLYTTGRSVGLNLLPSQSNFRSLMNIFPRLLTVSEVASAIKPGPRLYKNSATGPYIHLECFGVSNQPLWYYDINSAYLVGLEHFFPELASKLFEARQEATLSETKTIIKVLTAGIVGMLNSPRNRFYRPDIAEACYGVTRNEFTIPLIESIESQGGTEVRTHTDGVIGTRLVSVELGKDVGQWKIDKYETMTILGVNNWWGHRPDGSVHSCGSGLIRANTTESQVLKWFEERGDKPFPLEMGKRFSWKEADWVEQTYMLDPRHDRTYCASCKAGISIAQGLHLVRYGEDRLWN
jgi:hypothetical protein